jgi:hypothetical protein
VRGPLCYDLFVRITVTVSVPVARSLRGLDPPSAASRALTARAAAAGVTLAPQHPLVTDGPLVGFFTATLAPSRPLPDALAALRADPSVEGAWTTPAEELP